MEKKDKTIQFSKSGKGNITPRISLPESWVKKMGVTEDEKKVTTIQFSDGNILITKNFKQEGIMKEELLKESYEFGVKLKKQFLKENKKTRIHFYSANILQENQKEKNDVMYHLLNMCLEAGVESEGFFLDIIKGDKTLVQSIVAGLMSE